MSVSCMYPFRLSLRQESHSHIRCRWGGHEVGGRAWPLVARLHKHKIHQVQPDPWQLSPLCGGRSLQWGIVYMYVQVETLYIARTSDSLWFVGSQGWEPVILARGEWVHDQGLFFRGGGGRPLWAEPNLSQPCCGSLTLLHLLYWVADLKGEDGS